MHLLTLVELLENEVGSSASARANLDALLEERGVTGPGRKPAAARPSARRDPRAATKVAR